MFFSSAVVVPLCVLFSSLVDAEFVGGSYVASRNIPPNQLRKLSAVTIRSNVQSREELFKPRKECAHHYAEEMPSLSGGKYRFAKTEAKYRLPALVLEDIEMAVENIQCSDSTIVVDFAERQTLEAVRSDWDSLEEFLIISSHYGCNADGERAPYLVSRIQYDSDIPRAAFSVKSIGWRDAYDTMTVKFGTSMGQYPSHSFRTHEGLRKRVNTTASSTATASAGSNNTLHASIGFTVPANQAIFPVPGVVTSFDKLATVKCTDCFLTGTIDIIEGEFVISNSSLVIEEAVNFFNQGFFRATANNISARIELETKITGTKALSFNKTLITLGLPGFSIPNIATVGPIFKPVVSVSLAVQADVDFTYGFDLTIPDNSTITLDIANLNQSSTQGFNDAKINALQLQSTSPALALTLNAGFHWELSLGIDVLNGEGSINAGAFFDIPKLSVTVATGANLDKNCESQTTNLTSLSNAAQAFTFPSLIHVTSSVIVDVGLSAQANLALPALPVIDEQTATTLLGTSFSLPTACLSFDSSKGGLVKPTVSATTTTTTIAHPTATGLAGITGSRNSTSGIFAQQSNSGIHNQNSLLGRVGWSAVALLGVFFVALSL